MASPQFILASSSPRRLSLLADIGIAPNKVVSPDIDEAAQKGETPRILVTRLAREKLTAVMKDVEPQTVVLAADTLIACGRRVLGKARTSEEVASFMKLLSGRRHHVYTSVAACLVVEGRIYQTLSDSVVSFKRLSPAEIENYVASAEGLQKAGGYAIQGKAATFIRSIRGSHSGIVGLPLFETAQLLRRCGLDL